MKMGTFEWPSGPGICRFPRYWSKYNYTKTMIGIARLYLLNLPSPIDLEPVIRVSGTGDFHQEQQNRNNPNRNWRFKNDLHKCAPPRSLLPVELRGAKAGTRAGPDCEK